MRESISWKSKAPLVRAVVWRDIATAPKDGRMIEVAVFGERGWPKRTRWVNGAWDGGYKPTQWRTIERKTGSSGVGKRQ
jgi:hypothetical protein